MKNLWLTAALAAALFGATGVLAKGTVNPNKQVLAQSNINGSPLRINVGDDNSFQVFNTNVGAGNIGQIFPSSSQTLADMGWFVDVDGNLTAPAFDDHSGTATGSLGTYTEFATRTVTAVTGSGTTTLPYSVTVTGVTATGLSTVQTVTYVNGENYFRKAFRVTNPTGAAVSAKIFLASDIYLASSDAGKPYQEGTSGSPGGQTCAGITPVFTILHIPLGPSSSGFTATGYSSVWAQVGNGALDNAVNPANCIDNGAGLQWNVSIPANGSVTINAATSFGEIPTGLLGVGPPVWNYQVMPTPEINPLALTCTRQRFPFNALTNLNGWAPSEGEFYHEDPNFPGIYFPPVGLARAILDCFVNAWDAQGGALFYQYCWDNPTPNYIGTYPHERQAYFRIYHSINGVCDGPPPGTTIYEATVTLQRQLYYPPLPPPPPPTLQNGFE